MRLRLRTTCDLERSPVVSKILHKAVKERLQKHLPPRKYEAGDVFAFCTLDFEVIRALRPWLGNKIRIAICTEFGRYFFSSQQKNDTWLKLSAFSRSIQIGTIQSEKGGKQIKIRRNCNETFDCPDDGDGCKLASETQEQG